MQLSIEEATLAGTVEEVLKLHLPDFVTLPCAIYARLSSLFDVGKDSGRSNVQ